MTSLKSGAAKVNILRTSGVKIMTKRIQLILMVNYINIFIYVCACVSKSLLLCLLVLAFLR
jgi:hypothetical protein